MRPEAIIYANSSGVWPTWINARDNRQTLKYQDLLGAEGGFLYKGDPMWKTSATAKLLETQAEGKPTVIFSATRQESPWLHYNMSEDSVRQIIASTVANGASIWFGGYHIVGREDSLFKTLKEEFGFLKGISEHVEGTVSAANIALVWSPVTADFYGAEMPTIDFLVDKPKTEATKNFTEAFWGYYDALIRRQMAFDVLDDVALEGSNLGKYDCIVFPNVACMSEGAANALRSFVANGGSLVATYESSLYDSQGLRREDFLLGDVFGASYRGWLPHLDHDYILLRDGALVKGIGEKTIPAPPFALQVEPKVSAEVMGYFYEKTVGIFTSLPRVSDNPAILSSNFGKGRSVYFAGALDQAYLNHRFPAHHQLLTKAVEEAIQPIVSVSGAPQTVEVVVRKKPSTGSLIIHLINYTGERERPTRKVLPCRDIRLKLKTIFTPSRVKALRANRELKFKASDGKTETVLPKLKVYEVIVFEP
ncbi:MAG: beta-galactosidase trimerization domain-containing protein [Candidatus Bathyarchaeia archaeon]